jgi:hypothetical protein
MPEKLGYQPNPKDKKPGKPKSKSKSSANKTTKPKSTSSTTKTHIKKKAFIEALTKSLGIVTSASKITGIERTLHYDWLRDDPEYKKAVESIKDIAVDFAESKLHQNIQSGDTSSLIFYLKYQGRGRGYGVEKVETEHSGKIGIQQITGIEIK